ncbi:hypothetical protein ABES02_28500 [Neobacillus pocheonensis]|uniref:hypothetical protein n=1 Tax=Neobacillus pocheonensis TaxID=363869 RepID=UPI003D26C43C
MLTLEKRPDPLQLQQEVKKIILQDPCILKEQGKALLISALTEKALGFSVTLDFQAVKHYSPAFFDGLFQNTVLEDFKGINYVNISDLGRKMLLWAMNAHYGDAHKVEPLYRVYVTMIGNLEPVLDASNGIITVMIESGIVQKLEHNGTIKEIDAERYEQLISEKTKACIEYRKRQLAASKPLECPKCHQAYNGSINGYRKHVRDCKKGSW